MWNQSAPLSSKAFQWYQKRNDRGHCGLKDINMTNKTHKLHFINRYIWNLILKFGSFYLCKNGIFKWNLEFKVFSFINLYNKNFNEIQVKDDDNKIEHMWHFYPTLVNLGSKMSPTHKKKKKKMTFMNTSYYNIHNVHFKIPTYKIPKIMSNWIVHKTRHH